MWTSILRPLTATNWNIEVIDPKNKLLTFRNLAIHRSSFGMTLFQTNLKRYLMQMISFKMKLKFIDTRPLVKTTQYPQKLGKGTEIIFKTTKLKDVKLWHKIILFPRVYNYEERKVRSYHNCMMLMVIWLYLYIQILGHTWSTNLRFIGSPPSRSNCIKRYNIKLPGIWTKIQIRNIIMISIQCKMTLNSVWNSTFTVEFIMQTSETWSELKKPQSFSPQVVLSISGLEINRL